ncbi:hypothetical protein BC937DRAFT_91049 [Endogone sp. FLAS-F59071]|nr:hypothetical protein BC937DRAFT_91049 [Endogone sp. FLAS-F59071]|eukprot:RUS21911.1 hypothetical protein BC937DRAFT_91049 [Endogone sp. FLAS-F59071]
MSSDMDMVMTYKLIQGHTHRFSIRDMATTMRSAPGRSSVLSSSLLLPKNNEAGVRPTGRSFGATGMLCICIAAFVLQTELAQFVQQEMDFKKPYFLLYIGHSCYIFMIPFQFIYELLSKPSTDRAIVGTHRLSTLERYLSSFATSLVELISTVQPSLPHYGRTPINEPEDEDSMISTSTVRLFRPQIFYLFRLSISLASLICIPSYLWYISINLTSMANLTAIYNTACFFAYAFSIALLGERIVISKVAAVIFCIAGISIMNFWKSSGGDSMNFLYLSSSTIPFLGNAVATVGAASYGFYEVFYKKYASPHTASVLFANTITGLIGFATLLFLWVPLPLLHITGIEIFSLPNPRTFAYILLIASMGVLFNASFMCVIAMTSPVFAAVATMLTIPAVAIVDVFATGRGVLASTVAGSGLILVGFVLLCVELRKEKEKEDNDVDVDVDVETEPEA